MKCNSFPSGHLETYVENAAAVLLSFFVFLFNLNTFQLCIQTVCVSHIVYALSMLM